MLSLILAICGLILSIFFSSSEFALISANKLQIKVWLKQNKRGAGLAHSIILRKEEFLSCILVGTNLSNVLATSFATIYFVKLGVPRIWFILFITLIILLVGEILPKAITREVSNHTLRLVAPFLYLFRALFSPFTHFLKKTGWVETAYHEKEMEEDLDKDRDDLQHVYGQLEHNTPLEKDQQELIANVFDFSSAAVQDAMTPRTDISAVEIEAEIPKIMHMFIESGHSKLPVYESDIDHIVGAIHLYDLFSNPIHIRDILKPIHHVPFSKSAAATLTEFQTAHHAIAIVHDEHGGTAGLVTAEDLFEELFGEFEDEFDDENESASEKLKDGSILVSAKMDLDTFNDKWGFEIPEGSYETVGGYVMNAIGRIPHKGERLFLPIGQVLVRKSSARKIDQVQIFPKR
ncbi:MAG: HlyC/CorC family transporter [Candidatus Marinimicrobia bacterium]|nr:HlyC/CorC family transporter [Candidatus Neomarinimicrobiota bacterium]